jgi:HSP20 family molecular chaperone IbpA
MALFASPFDVFDALHSHRGFWHPPAKRHRRAHPFSAHHHPFYHLMLAGGDDIATADPADVFNPEVTETDRGFLVTALVPGVRASDVTVEAKPARRGGDVLLVRSEAHPHVKADLRLPTSGLVDPNNITASCIDGVLRVVIPKIAPTEEIVAVSSDPMDDAPAPAADAAAAPSAQTITLNVPGFNSGDITISRKRPAEELVVIGASERRGTKSFRREFRLADASAVVTASCVDGVLVIRVARPPAPPPHVVPVSAEPPALPAPGDDAEANGEDEITVLRRAVPGVPASAFFADVAADGTLRVAGAAKSAALGARRFGFVAKLPAGVDRGTLDARVVDGVLTITAAAPVAPERILIDVRSDVPAALPEAEKQKPREKHAPEDDEMR